jgi:hypothetical protein
LWLYFGAAGIADGQNVAATYAGFSAIWHGDSFVETLSGRSGASNGVNIVDGAFGGAFDHLGNAASWVFLQSGNPTATPPTTASGTVSALVGPRTNGGFGSGHVLFWSDLVAPASFGGDAVSMHLTVGGDGGVGFYLPSNLPLGQFTVLSAANAFTNTTLSPVAATWDASSVRIFGNGNQVGSVAITNSATFPVQNTVLGMAENNFQGQPSANNLLGRIDELRITTAVRSDAYLRAEGRAMQQLLLVFGSIESP